MKYNKELYVGSGLYDGDDGEIQNYSERVVRCRKPHLCVACLKEIGVGEHALYESGFMDGSPVAVYTCLKCIEAWLEESGIVQRVEGEG